MGKGKGTPEEWVAWFGRAASCTSSTAFRGAGAGAFLLASAKLPIRTRFVDRSDEL